MSTALTTAAPEDAAAAVEAAIMEVVGKRLDNSPEANAFRLIQRQASMLASSTLIPTEFRGNPANCAIGLNIAKRLGADPFMVLQNIDIIHGRPSFRATFLIAMVNASGRFSPLKFREDGEGDSFGCTAYATDKESGETVEGPKVNWEMVKAEGWFGKSGSKWKTMPQLMFRYRAAAFFARIYAPDITLGMQTAEEIHDAPPEPRNVTPPSRPGGESPASNPFDEEEPPAQAVITEPSPPKTAAQRKEEALAKIDEQLATGFDEPINRAQFEAMLRAQNLLGSTSTLMGMKLDTLENVAGSVRNIVTTAREAQEQ